MSYRPSAFACVVKPKQIKKLKHNRLMPTHDHPSFIFFFASQVRMHVASTVEDARDT